MLTSIEIQNYKSIEKLTLPLGRFNVLIGENGAGKSNILEAIALAGAASAGKLDNEFLASRGIRVTSPQLMRSGFNNGHTLEPIRLNVIGDDGESLCFELTNDNVPYAQWQARTTRDLKIKTNSVNENPTFGDIFDNFLKKNSYTGNIDNLLVKCISRSKENDYWEIWLTFDRLSVVAGRDADSFIIYSPENTSLRTFEREGQIEPLGINGEGLLKLLTVLSEPEYAESLKVI